MGKVGDGHDRAYQIHTKLGEAIFFSFPRLSQWESHCLFPKVELLWEHLVAKVVKSSLEAVPNDPYIYMKIIDYYKMATRNNFMG